MLDVTRIEVSADYETAERAGAAPFFQVAGIIGFFENGEQINLTTFIDQGRFYENGNELLKNLSQNCNEYSFVYCDIEII